jgi:hypothetical protein
MNEGVVAFLGSEEAVMEVAQLGILRYVHTAVTEFPPGLKWGTIAY